MLLFIANVILHQMITVSKKCNSIVKHVNIFYLLKKFLFDKIINFSNLLTNFNIKLYRMIVANNQSTRASTVKSHINQIMFMLLPGCSCLVPCIIEPLLPIFHLWGLIHDYYVFIHFSNFV